MLKNLVGSSYAPDYDFGGVTDPFLQVKLLRLMRLVGEDNAEASDAMSDVLAQVCVYGCCGRVFDLPTGVGCDKHRIS